MGRVLPTLRKQGSPLASGAEQRDLLARTPLPRSFADALRSSDLYPLRPTTIEILQINVGKRCNQTCRHCHVDPGPDRFEESIVGLRRLNALGYGKGTGLVLNLVTNPVGTYLPGSQAALERDWKRELQRRHDIEFDHLYTITNMPISRFLAFLEEQGRTEEYLTRLVNAYNPRAAAGVMCRNTLSVGWDGTLYDCDFNQMLELPVSAAVPRTIFDAERAALESRDIEIGPHCFGCTAGAGSSCGGAVAVSSAATSPWGTPGPARRGGTPPAPTPPAHPRRPPSSGDCRPRSRRPRPRPIPTSQATAKRRSSGPPRRSRSPAR